MADSSPDVSPISVVGQVSTPPFRGQGEKAGLRPADAPPEVVD
jgi:hypothetical protein